MNSLNDPIQQLILRLRPADFPNLREKVSIETLLQWSAEETYPRLAFRSAWALEHILHNDPALLIEYGAAVQRGYLLAVNWSVLRSYSKLIMVLISRLGWLDKIHADEQGSLLEKSFSLIETVHCPVAVRVNCWDILFGMTSAFDGLAQELRLHIEITLEKEPTAATKSRGLRILKQLNQSK